MSKQVQLSLSLKELEREGLNEKPEVWENGLRTNFQPGTFEQWRFAAQFEDDTYLNISFYTRPPVQDFGSLNPGLQIAITRPDGSQIRRDVQTPDKAFSASMGRCDLRSGSSWAFGDLERYQLKVQAQDLSATLALQSFGPPWRLGTGKVYFDSSQRQYYAWLAAIPFGVAIGELYYDGIPHPVRGTCYHDHTWGNVRLSKALAYFYLGRAQVGNFTLLFGEMGAGRQYGYQRIPIFMLAKGSQLLRAGGGPAALKRDQFVKHRSGRTYPQILQMDWMTPHSQIAVALARPRIIEAGSLLAQLPTWNRALSGWLGRNPYFFRFKSDLDLSVNQGEIYAREQGEGVYELILLQ